MQDLGVIVIACRYKNAAHCNVLLRAKQVPAYKAVDNKNVFTLFFFCCYVILFATKSLQVITSQLLCVTQRRINIGRGRHNELKISPLQHISNTTHNDTFNQYKVTARVSGYLSQCQPANPSQYQNWPGGA